MTKDESAYWEKRWQTGETGWDLGMVSPPIKQMIDAWPNKDARVLIPGCGNAYEAGYLLQSGFTRVTVIDISPKLIESLSVKFAPEIELGNLVLQCGDFFELQGTFDLILEQTFFCALHPSYRNAYASKMHELLANNGILTGVLFNREFEGVPPFGGSVEEYQSYFEPVFKSVSFEPCLNSVAPRLGSEVLFKAYK